MAKPGQSSFRRILLSRLLLLSIPVLVTGQFVAYRKAHSGMLETARYNLAQSAIQKGERFQEQLAALQSDLSLVTETAVIQSGPRSSIKGFLEQWIDSSHHLLQCAQLTDIQTDRLMASTCGDQPISPSPLPAWAAQIAPGAISRPNQQMLTPLPKVTALPTSGNPPGFVLSAPVYTPAAAPTQSGPNRKLRYALTVQTAFQKPDKTSANLSGYTIVIDQGGNILAHPNAQLVGQNIQRKPEHQRLMNVFTAAIAGKPTPASPLSFQTKGPEWLVGAKAIPVSIVGQSANTWVVLAAIPVETALVGLNEVAQVLLILTVGLLAAILLATLYLARDLAFPIEQLSDYALRIHQRYPPDRVPQNFKVKELNHLAEALDSMVTRLEDRAEELETAWQEAQIANQLKSEFLATTSHELRTPLNAIVGCVRLVHDGCCDDRQEELEFLQQADEAALHLLKIINDLLDIAKIEAGKVELTLQSVDVQELCRQCLKMVNPGAQMKRINLSLQLDPAIERVALDERRVRQMVINLLSNAVKFTPETGQVTLSTRLGYGYQLEQDTRPDLSPVNPQTAYLCLEVQDSGIGIPKDRWHLLFRPFQQIDSSLTRKHEGTGLGLALTKRLAELHGGTLSFRSVPGEGSTFRIWLPAIEMKST
jgi:signal transduction histidine kinase